MRKSHSSNCYLNASQTGMPEVEYIVSLLVSIAPVCHALPSSFYRILQLSEWLRFLPKDQYVWAKTLLEATDASRGMGYNPKTTARFNSVQFFIMRPLLFHFDPRWTCLYWTQHLASNQQRHTSEWFLSQFVMRTLMTSHLGENAVL